MATERSDEEMILSSTDNSTGQYHDRSFLVSIMLNASYVVNLNDTSICQYERHNLSLSLLRTFYSIPLDRCIELGHRKGAFKTLWEACSTALAFRIPKESILRNGVFERKVLGIGVGLDSGIGGSELGPSRMLRFLGRVLERWSFSWNVDEILGRGTGYGAM